MGKTVNRRGFLAGGASLAAIATGVTLSGVTLSGCAGSGPTPGGSGGNTEAVPPPTRIPYTGVKPELPEGEGGIPAGYFAYPKEPVKRDGFPLTLSAPVTTLLQSDQVILPRDRNSWWQAIEKQSGVTMEINTVTSTDYTAKFQTTIAGGQVPDLCQLTNVPGMPGMLQKYFADLSDHLSGDKIKEYPGLASIPTLAWQVPMQGGRIWGIPQPRPHGGQVASYRTDLLESFGITEPPELSSGEDFLALCRQLTDPKRSKYAMGAHPADWMLQSMLEMMGGPNTWSEEGGSFTHEYESPIMKDALAETGKMYQEGLIHPDGVANPSQNWPWWMGGTTSIYLQDFSQWMRYGRLYPEWRINVLTLPKWAGGGAAQKHLGNPAYGAWCGIRAGSEDRVKELLRFVDYIASPFGTAEYLTVNFGAEGTDHTLRGSDPILTETAATNSPQGLHYCGSQQYGSFYMPGDPDSVKAMHAYASKVLRDGVLNAALGLYSDESVTKGAAATARMRDAQTEIIVGRKPVSGWDDAVKQWQSETGDAQRQEYEEAFQKR